jgi:2-polyprenyl-3-methyl-5-hydroxy-6-metoxy-1,4-benzoquinol methylase
MDPRGVLPARRVLIEPDDYHQAIWQDLPAGLQPPHFQTRLAFLLNALPGTGSGDGAGTGSGDGTGTHVLDVGCGEGRFASALAAAGHTVVAVDVAAEPLRRARERDPAIDARLVAPHGPWPLPDASFDAVWAGEVIEHVLDTAAWFSELRRVLRSGGVLALSTPAHDWLTRLRLGLDARAFDVHFDPRGDHLRFYTRRALLSLLADFGFGAVRVRASGGVPGARRSLLASAVRSRY